MSEANLYHACTDGQVCFSEETQSVLSSIATQRSATTLMKHLLLTVAVGHTALQAGALGARPEGVTVYAIADKVYSAYDFANDDFPWELVVDASRNIDKIFLDTAITELSAELIRQTPFLPGEKEFLAKLLKVYQTAAQKWL